MVKSENRDRDGEMKSLNWWEKQFLVGRLLHEASCPGMGAGTGGRGEIANPQCSEKCICIHYVRGHFCLVINILTCHVYVVNIQSRPQCVCPDMLPWFQTAQQMTAV